MCVRKNMSGWCIIIRAKLQSCYWKLLYFNRTEWYHLAQWFVCKRRHQRAGGAWSFKCRNPTSPYVNTHPINTKSMFCNPNSLFRLTCFGFVMIKYILSYTFNVLVWYMNFTFVTTTSQSQSYVRPACYSCITIQMVMCVYSTSCWDCTLIWTSCVEDIWWSENRLKTNIMILRDTTEYIWQYTPYKKNCLMCATSWRPIAMTY